MADFSAATVAPELALSDHFPILSPAPRAVGRPNFTNYTLNVAGKAGEDWIPRNNNLIYAVGERPSEGDSANETNNFTHVYNEPGAALKKTPSQYFVALKKHKEVSPLS